VYFVTKKLSGVFVRFRAPLRIYISVAVTRHYQQDNYHVRYGIHCGSLEKTEHYDIKDERYMALVTCVKY
jgi:hypothetical protein